MEDTNANSWLDPKPEGKYQPTQCRSQFVLFAHLQSLRFSNSAFSLLSQLWATCQISLDSGAVGRVHGQPCSPGAYQLQEPCQGQGTSRLGGKARHRKIGDLVTFSKSLKLVLKKPWQQKK